MQSFWDIYAKEFAGKYHSCDGMEFSSEINGRYFYTMVKNSWTDTADGVLWEISRAEFEMDFCPRFEIEPNKAWHFHIIEQEIYTYELDKKFVLDEMGILCGPITHFDKLKLGLNRIGDEGEVSSIVDGRGNIYLNIEVEPDIYFSKNQKLVMKFLGWESDENSYRFKLDK